MERVMREMKEDNKKYQIEMTMRMDDGDNIRQIQYLCGPSMMLMRRRNMDGIKQLSVIVSMGECSHTKCN